MVNNNLKLVFTSRTTLLGIIEDCPDIPYQYPPPFVSFIDVPRRLCTRDNVKGVNNSHGEVNYLCFYVYFFSCISNIFISFRCIDVIGMVVAIFPLKMTRNRGTARWELLLCDMQYVFSLVNIFPYLLTHFSFSNISTNNSYM